MKTKTEVIEWMANYLYLNDGASSKQRAKMSAEEIVAKLIDAGLLAVETWIESPPRLVEEA